MRRVACLFLFFFKLLFHFSITSRYSSELKLYWGLNIYIYIYIYIYIGLRREKVGAGYTKESTIDVMIDGYEMIQSESMLPTLFNVHVKVIMHMITISIKQFHFDLI